MRPSAEHVAGVIGICKRSGLYRPDEQLDRLSEAFVDVAAELASVLVRYRVADAAITQRAQDVIAERCIPALGFESFYDHNRAFGRIKSPLQCHVDPEGLPSIDELEEIATELRTAASV